MNVKTIQTRLLVILLPLVLVALGLLSGVSYYLSQQSLTESIDQSAMGVGTDYANRVTAEMKLMMSQLEDLAANPYIRSGTDKPAIIATLTETQKRLGSFDVLAFALPDGTAVNSLAAAVNYSDRDYLKKVLATKKPVISDPLVSKATGKLAVILAVPVTNSGQLTGVVIGTFSMERMTALIKELKFLDTGYGQLVDESGLTIAHPTQPELTGKLNLLNKKINTDLKLQQAELDDNLIELFKTAAQAGKQSRQVYRFVDGVERVAVATPMELPGGKRWVMMVAAPQVEATREINRLARAIMSISVLVLLIAAVVIVIIARRFAKPISLIRDECLLLAKGDLRERETKVFSEDEIGQLAKGFQEMRTHLRQLVTKVHAQSEQMAASSEQLTASADQSAQAANQVAISITGVATGAENQLAAANETSVEVEQISDSIRKIAATSHAVAGQSAQAASKAHEGSKSVNSAVQQMTQIEQTVNASAKVVANLGERSKQIDEIVATISGIAGQTNLLALNAAIEAARAGEQGRGFAVVAEEVRKLAEQSEEATKQIASLIGGIQGDTDKAVQAMDNGTREVKLGAEVVNAAGQAFQEIVLLVTQVSDQVKEISIAIEQMAVGSQHIVSSVNRIDELSKRAAGEAQTVSAATEEQSASMEEIASSSQSLANLAMELREAVSKFSV